MMMMVVVVVVAEMKPYSPSRAASLHLWVVNNPANVQMTCLRCKRCLPISTTKKLPSGLVLLERRPTWRCPSLARKSSLAAGKATPGVRIEGLILPSFSRLNPSAQQDADVFGGGLVDSSPGVCATDQSARPSISNCQREAPTKRFRLQIEYAYCTVVYRNMQH